MFCHINKKKTAVVFIIVFLGLISSSSRAAAAGSPAATLASATAGACLPATTTANEMNRVIYQEFPAQGPTETAWTIVWTEFGYRGLWIEDAWFTPSPNAAPIHVLGQSGPSNIFVPYHEGSARLYDLNPWADLREAVLSYTGPCGTISGPALQTFSIQYPDRDSPPRPVLIKEIRERGVAWTSDGRTRRGEELLLWAVSDAGNYEYIIQYGFRDDGTITFRLGSTGYNNPGTPYESHMHNALWYIDINLGHPDHNSVRLMRHLEPDPDLLTNPALFPTRAKDVMEKINNGLEGFADWKAEEFTALNIVDTLTTNARGHNISYDLMPMRTGTARHDELFSKHDFWVTHNNNIYTTITNTTSTVNIPGEIYYDLCGLPCYLTNESIEDTDVVIWHISSNHHQPRDEDHEFDAQGNLRAGIAQVMWSGFDLHPRNLFDDAPLYFCAKVPQGIVGWWSFEEGSCATVIHDIKNIIGTTNNDGHPHPGSLGGSGGSGACPAGSGPTPVTGAVSGAISGGALSFDGIDDYVEINDDPSLNFGSGDFSVDAWIKTTQNSVTNVILDNKIQNVTHYQRYSLFLYNGKLGMQLATGSYVNYNSNAAVADGYWHHVAVTVNRTGGLKEIRWYVDGNHIDTSPGPVAGSLTNVSPLRFGANSLSLGGYLKGVLGELELFSRVLTPVEIHDIYAVGKCR